MSKPYPSALAYILQTRCSLTCRKGGCAHCHVFWWCLAMRGQQRWWSEVLLRYFTPFTVLSASVEQKGYMHTKAVFSWLFCGPVEGKPDFNCWTEICGHHVESGCKSLENFIIYQEVKQKFREAQFSVNLQCLFFFFFFSLSRKSDNCMSNKQETPVPCCWHAHMQTAGFWYFCQCMKARLENKLKKVKIL